MGNSREGGERQQTARSSSGDNTHLLWMGKRTTKFSRRLQAAMVKTCTSCGRKIAEGSANSQELKWREHAHAMWGNSTARISGCAKHKGKGQHMTRDSYGDSTYMLQMGNNREGVSRRPETQTMDNSRERVSSRPETRMVKARTICRWVIAGRGSAGGQELKYRERQGKDQQTARDSNRENLYLLWMGISRERVSRRPETQTVRTRTLCGRVSAGKGSADDRRLKRWVIVGKGSADDRRLKRWVIAEKGSADDQRDTNGENTWVIAGKGSADDQRLKPRKHMGNSRERVSRRPETRMMGNSKERMGNSRQRVSRRPETQTVRTRTGCRWVIAEKGSADVQRLKWWVIAGKRSGSGRGRKRRRGRRVR
ncbi:hypothetical protein BKA82DRAFT_4336913 [Pisolithus tinctorius]|nr:hypothetical protein BKA82DRAFT_4336913 [Pisolithus tinctorius]